MKLSEIYKNILKEQKPEPMVLSEEDLKMFLTTITNVEHSPNQKLREAAERHKTFLKENDEKNKEDVLEYLKKELKIKSKIVLGPSTGKKVADITFPKAGIFYIDIKEVGTFDSVRALVHELVYVKLVETKRIKYINDSLINFDGEDINLTDNTPDLPFEKEVEKMEDELNNKYWHEYNKTINTTGNQRSFFENVNTDGFFDVN